MAKIRGAKRYFRIGKEDISSTYGTPAVGSKLAAVSGAGACMRFFFVHEGSFSIKTTPIVEEQSVLRGQTGVLFRDQSGFTVAGDFSVLTHPESVRWFLDMALLRDVNGELHPYTIEEFYPGIIGTNATTAEIGAMYIGCKANQLQGAWGTNQNKVQLTLSVQGQREFPYGGDGTFGTPDPTAAGVYASKAGYFFTNSSLIDGLSLYGAAFPGGTLTLPAPGFTEVSFTIANNLTEGPRAFNPDVTLKGAITDLIAGQERLSGNFTLQWKDGTILTRFRSFADIVFRNIFIHPTSDSSKTFTGAQAASATPVTILTSASMVSLFPNIANENYTIAIQHLTAGNVTQWSTAKVTAVTATNITLSQLDINVAISDIIWTEAMELRFTQVNITDFSKQGGSDDSVVTVQGNFEGKAGTGATQLMYRTRGIALPIA